MNRRIICLAVAFSLPAVFAHAQGLNEVVVTANRGERPVELALADVTTIDSAAIARAGASSVPELLRSLGGIEISQTGGSGSISGLFVRGTKTAQTLVLVDGVRLENPTSGSANLEFLPLSVIDRIEIVRGPASVLYGSGAIGGVIQIFTRQGDGPLRPFASVGAGTQGTSRAQLGLSGTVGPSDSTRVSLAVSADRTAGFESTRPYSPNFQADRDGNWQRSVVATVRQALPGGWDAGVNLMSTSGRSRYDDAYSTPETARMGYLSGAMTGFLSGRPTPGWRVDLRAGQSRIDYEFDAFTFAPHTQARTLSWLNTLTLPTGQLMLGVEQLSQRIAGDGVTRGDYAYVRDSRTTDSVFAGYEIDTGRHQVRVQVRRDRIQTVGAEPTGALAWGVRLMPGWLVRASYASAFRAPTFDDLYSPFGANPLLRPERSRSAEVALEHRAGERMLKATAFATRIRDAIELDSTFTPRNLDSARVTGVTFEAREPIGAFTLRGQTTFQDPRGERFDQATGEVVTVGLARRAKRHAAFGVDWSGGPWKLGAHWLLQGPRTDSDLNRMAGYGVLDLDARRQLTPSLDLFARLGNLGDRRYETAWGYNMPPRTLFVGLRYRGG